MPIKPNLISKPVQPLTDGHTDARPVKGFQRVVALIAKPLKELVGLEGSGRPAGASASAANPAPGGGAGLELSAEDLERVERSFARTAASLKVDDIFDSELTALEECKTRFLEIRQLILDVNAALRKCNEELSALPAFDERNKSRIQSEILELKDIEAQAKIKKTECAFELRQIFDAEIKQIQDTISLDESKLPARSLEEQDRIEAKIAKALFQIHDLKVNQGQWLDGV